MPSTRVHYSDIRFALRRAGVDPIRVFDNWYNVCTQSWWEIAVSLWEPVRPFVDDDHDCDDFALDFMMWCRSLNVGSVGIVISVGAMPHVFNVIVFQDNTVHFFEPQSRTWLTKDNGLDKGLYLLEGATVLI